MRAHYPCSAAAFDVSDCKSVSSTATKAGTMSGMGTSHSETKRAEFWTSLILALIKLSGQRKTPREPSPSISLRASQHHASISIPCPTSREMHGTGALPGVSLPIFCFFPFFIFPTPCVW